ncbi:hypothetical protein FOA52_002082 [Chlamydomonas sp. UWO 241]|nr:hypothetical protein FOA52_002082 [Chlamydomonas sp. UWO 241]
MRCRGGSRDAVLSAQSTEARFVTPCGGNISGNEGCGNACAVGTGALWLSSLLAATYFGPCLRHTAQKKNECTYFCTSCLTAPTSLCQHCMHDHRGHSVIQIRRYVYCDVVRVADISQHVDITGLQAYVINQAKVVFLNPRPQAKLSSPSDPDCCRNCRRTLREGFTFCCVACKVDAMRNCLAGDCGAGSPPAAANAGAAAMPAPAAPGLGGGQLKRSGASVSEVHSPIREDSPEAAVSRTKATKPVVPTWLARLRDGVWAQIEDLFEEFTPWLKWLVFDSLLLLIVRFLSRRSTRLEALFEALGWL